MVRLCEDEYEDKLAKALIILAIIAMAGLNIGTILDLAIPKENEPFHYLGRSVLILSPALFCLGLSTAVGTILALGCFAFIIIVGAVGATGWGLSWIFNQVFSSSRKTN